MAPPYDPGYLTRSLVRVPGSGRNDPKASILCDLSRVSTLAATFPIPRNLPPALVSSPSGLPDNIISQVPIQPPTYTSDPRKRFWDQVFRGDESYSTLKVSNRGSTIIPAVVVLSPRNHMRPFISTSQPQEGRKTPQVLVTHPQDSPASLGVVTQLHQPMAHLQSLFHHTRSAPQEVVVQVQSLLQQAANLLQQATNPAPQETVAQVSFFPQQSNISIQKEAELQPSPPVSKTVAVLQQSYVSQNVIPQESHLQQTNPSSQKVVVPHQSHLQRANPVVFHQPQLEPNISKRNVVVDAVCMTEVAEEARQLREDNHTLRRQVLLFQQLFRDKQRLLSVIRTLGVL